MVIRKMMTNTEIYGVATALVELYNHMTEDDMKFPVKVNFYFQKNMKTLVDMAKELDDERAAIVTKFGTPDPEDSNKVNVDPEKIDEANKELSDLFALEQEVVINTIDLEWFDGIMMTPAQVQAISFMIKEDEE